MIKVNHLSKKFGNLEVLKDINLDINEGAQIREYCNYAVVSF